jgi:translation initiation factor 2B subunit (eIF-2B alpha/beta/delta family)
MQFLYLTSVDKTFGKLKEKEEILFQQKHLANNAQTIAQNALNKSSNPLDEDVLSLKKKALKAKVLVEKKEKEIALAKQTLFDEMEKIASPLRSHFVLETLKKNTKEIQILSQEKQQMLYQSQQQIQQISPFSRMSNK